MCGKLNEIMNDCLINPTSIAVQAVKPLKIALDSQKLKGTSAKQKPQMQN